MKLKNLKKILTALFSPVVCQTPFIFAPAILTTHLFILSNFLNPNSFLLMRSLCTFLLPTWRAKCSQPLFSVTILWSTDTDMDTGHGTDSDTPTRIIIWENDIIQCNDRCWVGVGHQCVFDTGTHRIRGASVLHSYYLIRAAGGHTSTWCVTY